MPFCSYCGSVLTATGTCQRCNVPPITAPAPGDDAAIRMLLPVGRSGWAIASGYLALFSVLPIFAPFALITGILALRDIKKHPKKHGKGRAWFGIIMGGFISALIVIVLILSLFAASRVSSH